MKITFGTDLFGDVKTRAGIVSTKFFHIAELPLIPLGSYRVDDQHQEGFVGTRIGLHLGSLALGYFRRWGFLASLGLAAWSVYMFGRPSVPWSTLVLVPVLAMVLMGSTIASWHLLGGEGSRRSAALWSGIPVAIMLAASVFLWVDRASYDAIARRSVAEYEAEQQKRRTATSEPVSPEDSERMNDLNQWVYALTTAFQKRTTFSSKACNDDIVRATAANETARELVVAEYDFLVTYNDQREDVRRQRGWVMTPAVHSIKPMTPPTTMTELDKQPFWAVLQTRDVPARRGKRALRGTLAIYKRGSGDFLCATTFEVNGDGELPPADDVQRAYKAAARKKLASLSTELRIYSADKIAKR